MSITPNQIKSALSHVEEPDLKKDLVSLNMIQDIDIQGNKVKFTVVLTTPACPLKEQIRTSCEEAIAEYVSPNLEVEVNMTANVTSLRTDNTVLPNVKNVIAIASGKGGVGKSTISANLAVALAETGAKVGLVDADIYGPSIPTMFDCETAKPGVVKDNNKNIIIPVQKYGVKLLSIGFLAAPEEAVIWRGPMASSALRQFLSDADWGKLDYLLIDLPPGTSDIHLTLVQTIPVNGAVVVTTPQKVALADAQKAIAMFQQPKIDVPILGVVENMAYFTPEELPNNKYYIFGQEGGKLLAKRNEVNFLGEIPIVQGVRESGDAGMPIVLQKNLVRYAFEEVAQEVARTLAVRNATTA